MLQFIGSHKALELMDRNCPYRFGDTAVFDTQLFDRANESTHSGKDTFFSDDLICGDKIPRLDLTNEPRDVHSGRARFHTRGIITFDAP